MTLTNISYEDQQAVMDGNLTREEAQQRADARCAARCPWWSNVAGCQCLYGRYTRPHATPVLDQETKP